MCDGLKSATQALNWEKRRFKVKKMKVSIMVQLNLWRTYLSGKVNYFLFLLLFCPKSSMNKFISKINVALKHSIGLAKCVGNDRVYFIADMLTPDEQATKYLIRLLIKVLKSNIDPHFLKDIMKILSHRLETSIAEAENPQYLENAYNNFELNCKQKRS